MVKQLAKGKERLTNAYWSIVGMASVAMLSLQPVMADTIWDRFSTILQDIYGQVVGLHPQGYDAESLPRRWLFVNCDVSRTDGGLREGYRKREVDLDMVMVQIKSVSFDGHTLFRK